MVNSVGYILITLAFLQVQRTRASAIETPKGGLVKILTSANDILLRVETYADNQFAGRIKNETGIKEWSVNIQTDVAARVTNRLFTGFEQFKKAILSKSRAETFIKVLNCISAEEPTFFASVKGAASKNGWCNNRLALNLTLGFKATTSALLAINVQTDNNIKNLYSCHGSRSKCLISFFQEEVSLYKSNGALGNALKEVVRVYSVMFGEDVPQCNREILFPQIRQGVAKSLKNILVCAAKQ